MLVQPGLAVDSDVSEVSKIRREQGPGPKNLILHSFMFVLLKYE